MLEYKMPALGADMESGTLVQWHVKPGDTVKRGDIVADVETEKGTIEAEIWTPGTVTELIVHPGQKVPVGTVLALLQTEAGEVPVAASAPAPAPIAPTEKRIRVSPLARRVAAERGVDLSQIQGTGEGGAITMADIETYAAPHAPPAEALPSADRMRRAIAQAMSRSKREIPHYYLQTDINMQKALDWLEKFNHVRPLTERVLRLKPASRFRR
jgi:pyruvate dehydrogenase E2 component (dihydrolipoamide acetyltransferase)